MALTGKKKAFADAVLAGKSNKDAAVAAGYSEKTASAAGSRLVKDPDVKAYLDKHRQAPEWSGTLPPDEGPKFDLSAADTVAELGYPTRQSLKAWYKDYLEHGEIRPPKRQRDPKFTLEIPDASKDYSRIFQLNPNVTYSQGLSNIFSLSNSRYFSSNPFGLTGFWGSTDNLQMGSFTLKNGMRIHTYGEYDKDGWKVPNPSALPWEKNNFKGAFELKSANGAFGIRIEVQQGRHVPY